MINTVFQHALLAQLPHRNIHFLVGLNDSLNCKLQSQTIAADHSNTISKCDDNELATYCQAMLQGENRLDRFEKWRAYVNSFYSSSGEAAGAIIQATQQDLWLHNNVTSGGRETGLHNKVWYVRDVAHDPLAMLHSQEAHCMIFQYCPVSLVTHFLIN